MYYIDGCEDRPEVGPSSECLALMVRGFAELQVSCIDGAEFSLCAECHVYCIDGWKGLLFFDLVAKLRVSCIDGMSVLYLLAMRCNCLEPGSIL